MTFAGTRERGRVAKAAEDDGNGANEQYDQHLCQHDKHLIRQAFSCVRLPSPLSCLPNLLVLSTMLTAESLAVLASGYTCLGYTYIGVSC